MSTQKYPSEYPHPPHRGLNPIEDPARTSRVPVETLVGYSMGVGSYGYSVLYGGWLGRVTVCATSRASSRSILFPTSKSETP